VGIRRGLNDFVRIRFALTMEPHLEQKALDNMRAGGKLKGFANLPEARHIDVEKEIARIAGVRAVPRWKFPAVIGSRTVLRLTTCSRDLLTCGTKTLDS
jgi:hypothetical protein